MSDEIDYNELVKNYETLNKRFIDVQSENKSLREEILKFSSSSRSSGSKIDDDSPIPRKKKKYLCQICQINTCNLPRHLETTIHKDMSPQQKDEIMKNANLRPMFVRKLSSSDESNSASNSSSGSYPRMKKSERTRYCYICNSYVVKLPDHLKSTHRFNNEQVNQYFDKHKKRYSEDNVEKMRQCPICDKQLLRLDRHLISRHQTKSGTEMHLNYLKEASDLRNRTLATLANETMLEAIELQRANEINLFYVLDDFYKWAVDNAGGKKAHSTAQTYVRHLKKVLTCISDRYHPNDTYKVVFESEFTAGDVVECYLRNPELQILPPKTQQSIGYSIKRFLEFILYSQIVNNKLLKVDKKQVKGLEKLIQNFVNSFNKDIRIEELKKKRRKSDIALTNEELNDFYRSDEVKRIQELIKNSDPNSAYLLRDLTSIQGYLILITLIQSFNRLGAVARMKVNEFLKAEKIHQFRIIEVEEHKTFAVYGHAKLMIRESTYQEYLLFYNNIRLKPFKSTPNSKPKQLQKTDPTQLFYVPSKGHNLDSSKANTYINKVWTTAGHSNKKITGSLIRTWISTIVYHNMPTGSERVVRDMMSHSQQTGEKYYINELQKKEMLKVRIDIAGLLGLDLLTPDVSSNEEVSLITNVMANIADNVTSQEIEDSRVKKQETQNPSSSDDLSNESSDNLSVEEMLKDLSSSEIPSVNSSEQKERYDKDKKELPEYESSEMSTESDEPIETIDDDDGITPIQIKTNKDERILIPFLSTFWDLDKLTKPLDVNEIKQRLSTDQTYQKYFATKYNFKFIRDFIKKKIYARIYTSLNKKDENILKDMYYNHELISTKDELRKFINDTKELKSLKFYPLDLVFTKIEQINKTRKKNEDKDANVTFVPLKAIPETTTRVTRSKTKNIRTNIIEKEDEEDEYTDENGDNEEEKYTDINGDDEDDDTEKIEDDEDDNSEKNEDEDDDTEEIDDEDDAEDNYENENSEEKDKLADSTDEESSFSSTSSEDDNNSLDKILDEFIEFKKYVRRPTKGHLHYALSNLNENFKNKFKPFNHDTIVRALNIKPNLLREFKGPAVFSLPEIDVITKYIIPGYVKTKLNPKEYIQKKSKEHPELEILLKYPIEMIYQRIQINLDPGKQKYKTLVKMRKL